MNVETKRSFKILTLLHLIIVAVGFFKDKTIATGALVSLVFNSIYLILLNQSVTAMLDRRSDSKVMISGSYSLRMAMLIAPIFIAAVLPEYINMVATLICFVCGKVAIIYPHLRKKEIS